MLRQLFYWCVLLALFVLALVFLSNLVEHAIGQPSAPSAALAAAPVPSPASSSALPASVDRVMGPPTLSASFIDRVLAANGSPAVGLGAALYHLSRRYGIDDAFALAFFFHESRFGTRGEARLTHSLGNLRCIAGAACIDQDRGGYASFPTWEAGAAAWYALIAGPLYVGSGLVTLDQIIPRYAPSDDRNDVASYIASVRAAVSAFRAGRLWL